MIINNATGININLGHFVYNFSDWFLPSKDLVPYFHTVLYDHGVGNFNENSCYWTSSEYTNSKAWIIAMITGGVVSSEKNL